MRRELGRQDQKHSLYSKQRIMKQKCTRVCSYSTWTIPELCTDCEKAFGGVYNPLNGDSFPTSICSSVCFVHLRVVIICPESFLASLDGAVVIFHLLIGVLQVFEESHTVGLERISEH